MPSASPALPQVDRQSRWWRGSGYGLDLELTAADPAKLDFGRPLLIGWRLDVDIERLVGYSAA